MTPPPPFSMDTHHSVKPLSKDIPSNEDTCLIRTLCLPQKQEGFHAKAIMIPKALMVLIMIPDKDNDKDYDEHK